jgi:hypothetical protein
MSQKFNLKVLHGNQTRLLYQSRLVRFAPYFDGGLQLYLGDHQLDARRREAKLRQSCPMEGAGPCSPKRGTT